MTDQIDFPRSFRDLFSLCILLSLCTAAFAQGSSFDFKQGTIDIVLLPQSKQVKGSVRYDFELLNKGDSLFINARNMVIDRVLLAKKEQKFSYDGQRIGLKISLAKKGKNQLQIEYTASPSKAMYFLGWADQIQGNEQIWTQGQGQNNSHWVPSFEDMRVKLSYRLRIRAPQGFQLLSNGVLNKTESEPKEGLWVYEQKQPISAYLLAIALGNYREYKQTSTSGIPLFQYLYPEDSLRYTGTYHYTRPVFDFLEEEIGQPYPFDNYKEVPVFDFLYAGMENASCTLFSDQFVQDQNALPQESYLGVQAHEMVHQWWGNLVTEASGEDHWLHEGFATYYAQLAEAHIRGEAWFTWNALDKALQLKAGVGQSLLDPGSSSLTFYEKGAWALRMLREKVGDKAFKESMSRVLQKYRFKNLGVDQFLDEMTWQDEGDRTLFEENWLKSTDFPWTEVKRWLVQKNPDIVTFLGMQEQLSALQKGVEKDSLFLHFWRREMPSPLRIRLLRGQEDRLPLEEYWKALKDLYTAESAPDRELRRALLFGLNTEDPSKVQQEFYRSFLNEEDPVVGYHLLYNLWRWFPAERGTLLEGSKRLIPFMVDEFAVIWNLLNLAGAQNLEEAQPYIKQLKALTTPAYPAEVRLMATNQLSTSFGNRTPFILNAYLRLSVHHKWRIRKAAGQQILELLKDPTIRQQYEKGLPERSEQEQKRLRELLELSKSTE